MRIHVGIIGSQPGWQLLLSQEGIPFSFIQNPDETEECSAIVAGDDCPVSLRGAMQDYLHRGGGILASGIAFGRISGTETTKKFIRWLLPERDSPFADAGLTDLFLDAHIPEGANMVVEENGKLCVLNREFQGGYVIAFPFDPASAILDQRRMTKSFYAARPRLPYESLTAVAKNSVRILVRRGLEILHHKRGLPYAHLWYYPDNVLSIAAFRVDTDFADEKELEGTYSIAERGKKPFTWFVDVQSQENSMNFYRQMKDQEIGVHCYRHKRYPDPEEAFRDLTTAISVMRKNDFEVRSCALPYGQWSVELAEIVERLKMTYASDFSYDADNYPSTPVLRDRFSNVLQVPIHPVSIGNLSRQGFRPEEMLAYYRSVIERKRFCREPVILYYHPKNGCTEIIDTILSDMGKTQCRWMKMIEYAEWWNRRITLRVSIDIVDNHCHIRSDQTLSGFGIHLTRKNGTEAFSMNASLLELDTVEWKKIPQSLPFPDDIDRTRKFNPWIPLQRLEDSVYGFFK